ncbi:hypothetical protein KOW79_008573 [Hemibagrus wyckioides]|uniref:Uncharacterized protein n=1 Tax=Hemibagrus wyckioides TaxID=337641 RepID=A0A9D3NU42_9TELE|nr:hypothetical protein KOW79_008573 [Hemibagrus wyckioides]
MNDRHVVRGQSICRRKAGPSSSPTPLRPFPLTSIHAISSISPLHHLTIAHLSRPPSSHWPPSSAHLAIYRLARHLRPFHHRPIPSLAIFAHAIYLAPTPPAAIFAHAHLSSPHSSPSSPISPFHLRPFFASDAIFATHWASISSSGRPLSPFILAWLLWSLTLPLASPRAIYHSSPTRHSLAARLLAIPISSVSFMAFAPLRHFHFASAFATSAQPMPLRSQPTTLALAPLALTSPAHLPVVRLAAIFRRLTAHFTAALAWRHSAQPLPRHPPPLILAHFTSLSPAHFFPAIFTIHFAISPAPFRSIWPHFQTCQTAYSISAIFTHCLIIRSFRPFSTASLPIFCLFSPSSFLASHWPSFTSAHAICRHSLISIRSSSPHLSRHPFSHFHSFRSIWRPLRDWLRLTAISLISGFAVALALFAGFFKAISLI